MVTSTPSTGGNHYPHPKCLTRVPNLTQSSKLTQGLGHVSTFGNGVNGYLQLKEVSKVVLPNEPFK